METVFEQKRRFDLRRYTLYSDRILVEINTVRQNQKYEVKLDEIGYKIRYQSDSFAFQKAAFYVCLSLLVLVWILHFVAPRQMDTTGVVVGTLVLGFFISIIKFKKLDDDIFLFGGQVDLVFFRAIPNKESVLDFINQVITTSKTYLRKKYGIVNTTISEEMFLGRLNWLKDNEVISEEELYELKNEFNVKKHKS